MENCIYLSFKWDKEIKNLWTIGLSISSSLFHTWYMCMYVLVHISARYLNKHTRILFDGKYFMRTKTIISIIIYRSEWHKTGIYFSGFALTQWTILFKICISMKRKCFFRQYTVHLNLKINPVSVHKIKKYFLYEPLDGKTTAIDV